MRRDFKLSKASARALAAALLMLSIALLMLGMTRAAPSLRVRQDARGGRDGSASLSKILGDWEGESVCVGNRPACKNEHVVYHISEKAGEADAVTLAADKIINGKPEEMGVLECKYDASKSTLTCEFTVNGTHGVFEYTVKDDEMEGTLKILPAGTIGRRVKVRKLMNVPPAK
jgi:hypothetical protein